jgi:hypothetical protein
MAAGSNKPVKLVAGWSAPNRYSTEVEIYCNQLKTKTSFKVERYRGYSSSAFLGGRKKSRWRRGIRLFANARFVYFFLFQGVWCGIACSSGSNFAGSHGSTRWSVRRWQIPNSGRGERDGTHALSIPTTREPRPAEDAEAAAGVHETILADAKNLGSLISGEA